MSPGLFGRRDEVGWTNPPPLGVVPANQRLETDQPAGIERHDGLIVEGKLRPLDCPAEIGFQVKQGEDIGMHRLVEDLETGLTRGLGAVHRRVGIAEQVVGTDIVRVAEGDADLTEV